MRWIVCWVFFTKIYGCLAQPQNTASLGYRFDVQKMDFFHTLSYRQTKNYLGMEAYAGAGHRNAFSRATFYPQMGFQLQFFPLAKQKGCFTSFYLHADASIAYLARPFAFVYPRFQCGYGFLYTLPGKQAMHHFQISHQMGIAYNTEISNVENVPFLDYRFSLGLNYVFTK